MPTKHIAAIYIVLEMKGHDLLDLPKRMHWHAPIGLRNVGLPENEIEIRFLLPQIAKSIAQIFKRTLSRVKPVMSSCEIMLFRAN